MRIIGNDLSVAREATLVASGTISSGDPIVANDDGTVSSAVPRPVSTSIGTTVEFYSGTGFRACSGYDSTNNKIIVAYDDNDNSSYGTARVGTINPSDNSISFGTAAVFESASVITEQGGIAHDVTNNKIVIVYRDVGNSNYGTAVVGTVSGTTISFGTPVVFSSSNQTLEMRIAYSTTASKFLIAYRDNGDTNKGKAVVGTVSGTSISFGTVTQFEAGTTTNVGNVYVPTEDKFFISYRDGADNIGKALMATVSGTSVTFGSTANFETNVPSFITPVYDSKNDKVILIYRTNGDGGRARVASIDGNTITYGTAADWDNGGGTGSLIDRVVASFDKNVGKVVFFYRNKTSSNPDVFARQYNFGEVSGTDITFGTKATIGPDGRSDYFAPVYDANAKRTFVSYDDQSDSSSGKGNVITVGGNIVPLTSENFIGFSRGIVDAANQTQGSSSVFLSARVNHLSVAYDSTNEKVVFVYADTGNSNYGTAVVATISGSSVSFGTPVVFESGNARAMSATFDSTNDRVVIVYRDNSNSDQGTAIVGTVSGTSISFGTPVIFNDNNTRNTMQVVFDSSNDKVVIAYSDVNFRGKGIVGTVSGTSISFGSAATFQAPSGGLGVDYVGACFDSTNNKVVVTYRDALNNTRATAAVGTVSGTSITFGSDVEVHTQSGATYVVPVFDPTEGKVVVYFNVGTSGNRGRACVGTVSGTTISFGDENIYYNNDTKSANNKSATYDAKSGKIVLGFQIGTLNYGALVAGKVSGNDITFDDVLTFSEASTTNQIALVYDSANEKVAVGFRDPNNSDYGTAFALTTSYDNRETVAVDGQAFVVDTIGTVSSSQPQLTPGQSYYVINSTGKLSTTAGTPSVFAGTAVGTTKLIVKG